MATTSVLTISNQSKLAVNNNVTILTTDLGHLNLNILNSPYSNLLSSVSNLLIDNFISNYLTAASYLNIYFTNYYNYSFFSSSSSFIDNRHNFIFNYFNTNNPCFIELLNNYPELSLIPSIFGIPG